MSINVWIGSGRLGQNIELRKTSSGLSVTNFSIAIDRRTNSKDHPESDWIDCQAWRQQADYLAKYAKKGTKLMIEGHIQKHTYKKNGIDYVDTEIVVDQVEIGSQPRSGTATPKIGTSYYSKDIQSAGPDTEETTIDVSSDDLPF